MNPTSPFLNKFERVIRVWKLNLKKGISSSLNHEVEEALGLGGLETTPRGAGREDMFGSRVP